MEYPSPQYPHSELTQKIIGCAQAVHRELKNGLTEKIYENSLCLDFAHHHLKFSQQKVYPVSYRGRPVGKLIPDLVVENKVIVDTKVVEDFTASHISQMLSYLKITNLTVGLLINFKHNSLKIKRIAAVH